MFSGSLRIRKCLKGQFKIVSFLSCLLCVDTTPFHLLSYIAFLFNCENSTKTGKTEYEHKAVNVQRKLLQKAQRTFSQEKIRKLQECASPWKQIIRK